MTPECAPSGPVFGSPLALAAVGFLVVPTMILHAPIEPMMGFVQKIFYFHVPCAIMLFLSTFVCAGGSIAFLFKGSERGDRLAVAAAELSVLFGVCVLTSGPLWGRKAWGVWWQWDARLTSSLLLFLMMVGVPDRAALRRPGGPQAGGGAGAVRRDQRAAGLQERRHLAHGSPPDHRGADAGSAHAPGVLERVRC